MPPASPPPVRRYHCRNYHSHRCPAGAFTDLAATVLLTQGARGHPPLLPHGLLTQGAGGLRSPLARYGLPTIYFVLLRRTRILRAPSATRCPRMDTPPAPWSPGLAATCLCPSPPFFTRRQPLHLLPPLIAQPFSIRPCQLLQSSFYSTKLFLWPHPLHQMRQVMLKIYHLAHFCGETVSGAAENIPPGALLGVKRARWC